MSSRYKQAKAMREAGKTYKEIGEAFGVTRQRAKQLTQYVPGDWVHVDTLLDIPYKGLREWMVANKVSVAELCRRCECDVRRAVMGRGASKHTLDAILRATGLDYETCFEESPAEVD